jgi:hypothetical protein
MKNKTGKLLGASESVFSGFLAEKSGPMIPFSQPDLIVSVVSEVIRLAR